MIHRFIISGDNVQGIQLREAIVKTANHKKLKGSARNLLTGDVELLFVCENNAEEIKGCIAKALEFIAKSGLLEKEEINSITINDNKPDSFKPKIINDEETENILKRNKFELVREHELREIVWALQGAGKVFLSASTKVETLLGYKEREVRGRLESVKRELLHMQNHIENVHDPVCIKQFIADPLIDMTAGKSEEEDLIRDLIEFYHDYVSYKKKGSRTQEAEKEYMERIKMLIEGINLQMERFNNTE